QSFATEKEKVSAHVSKALSLLEKMNIKDWTKLGEVPFSYYIEDKGQLMTGLIDLLLVNGDEYHIVDYKSDGNLDDSTIKSYAGQLEWYKKVVLELNPKASVKMSLLGTAQGKLIELEA
ncbi:MAG: PD-(D/E)XK nuclease family protein, partial [Bacteriovoracaceae bacterium]|nr:PD-(D/E)XK nuclease family protein [Bacteriovoracaceae bacterium]